MGRLLGIDHGQKRIGLAISDPGKVISKPLQTLKFSNIERFIIDLTKIIYEQNIEKIIIGKPLGMSGNETDQTQKVKKFIKALRKSIKVPCEMIDERLSSISAKKSLITIGVKTGHNKSRVDETAAAIFLQHYLDKTNYK